jgi:hypothetical protein
MDQNQSGPTFEEGLKEVMQSLPPFIREYLAQGKYTPVAQSLMGKYKLRIDQGGVLERELLMLLMGIENPTEFVSALTNEAGIPQEMVNGIVQDINDQVFVPLRRQEEMQSKRPPIQSVLAPKPLSPAPKPVAPMPAHMAPLPPKIAMPKSGSLGDIVRRIAPPSQLDSSKLLEDHEEPHIELKAPAPSAPAMQSPQIKPQPPMPTTPASMPTPSVPPAPVTSRPPAPPIRPLPPKPIPPPPPITSYGVDPYREPLDDEKE